MQTIPSMYDQVSTRKGDPYKILVQFPFNVTPLTAGTSRPVHVPLNKNTAVYIDAIGCDWNPNNDGNPCTQENEILVNIYDSRNLTRWFLPDAVPLSLMAGNLGSRLYRVPTAFYIPAGQDLFVEVTNKTVASLGEEINFVLSGVLVGIPTGARNGI